MYIYIYIYIERERYTYTYTIIHYSFIYMYTYTLPPSLDGVLGLLRSGGEDGVASGRLASASTILIRVIV